MTDIPDNKTVCSPDRHDPKADHSQSPLASKAFVTIYSKFVRHICHLQRGTSSELSWPLAVLLITIIPLLIFVIWMASSGTTAPNFHLRVAMWLAGTWIFLGPFLSVAWERRYFKLCCHLDLAPAEEGWNKALIAKVVGTWDKYSMPMSLLTAAVTTLGFLLNLSFFQHHLGVGRTFSLNFYEGTLVVVYLGYSFGTGIWGAIKALLLARAAIKPGIVWHPFRPGQVASLEEFGSFSYLTGFYLSVGSIFLPGLYIISPALNTAAWIAGGTLAGSLVVISLLSFLYPTYLIHRLAADQKDVLLQQYSSPLEVLEGQLLDNSVSLRTSHLWSIQSRTRSLLDLRHAIETAANIPMAQWVAARTASLILLPLAVSIIEALVIRHHA